MEQLLKASVGTLMNPRIAAAAVLIGGFILTLALNFPGQLSYDSIAQLHDGRIGIYSSWHPPVMAWMLGLADDIVPGAGLFVIFDTGLLFGSMLSLLWLTPKTSWLAPPVALVCILLPQFLLYQGIVWKDVLFADAAIAGFVCIAHAGRRWQRVGLRNALLAMSIALLVLATLARQNGAIVLVFGVVAISLLAGRQASSARYRAALLFGGGTAFVALCLWVAASTALAMRTPGESGPKAQLKLLEFYDLIGAVKAEPGLNLARIESVNPDLEQLMRTDGVDLYTPQRNDTLVGSADLQNELSDTTKDTIFAQWRDFVLAHPWLYLQVRTRVFGWTFLTPDISRCAPLFVGVEGLPRFMRDLNLTPRMRPQDEALKTYGGFFVETPVLSHVTFMILALGAIVVLLRRREPAELAMACLLTSAVAFGLSFFVISIACDYRYLIFLDLAALVSAFQLAATRPQKRPNDSAVGSHRQRRIS